jgi:effector-binding domain-containing protein
MNTLLLILTAALAFVQTSESGPVRFENRAPFHYVAMSFPGYGEPEPESIQVFLAEIGRQGLMESLKGPLFAVMSNSRLLGEKRVPSWDLGFRVEETLEVRAPLAKRRYDFETFAVILHKGPYEIVNVSWNVIVRMLETEGWTVLGAPLQTWLGNPAADAPDAQRIEIAIPVRKTPAHRIGGRP